MGVVPTYGSTRRTATAFPKVIRDVPYPVHVTASAEVANEFPPDPAAIQSEPFHATALPAVVNAVFPRPVHVIPSVDDAIVSFVPCPTATQSDPFHAIPYAALVSAVVPRPVHVIPSGEVA